MTTPPQEPGPTPDCATPDHTARPARRLTNPHDDTSGPRALVRNRALRRLIEVRIASSFGDGAFQGALVSAVLFNPTRESSAGAIAAAFAVLLLPYSVVGPFAGALLDRWSRRTVMIAATLLRAALVLLVALSLALGSASWVLLVGALLVTGAARFVGSGLSAALPHTVPSRALVPANALAVTCGAIASACGAGYAIVMRGLIGETDGPVAVVTASVTVFYLLAVMLVRPFARRALGPSHPSDTSRPIVAVAKGLSSGLGHAVARPTVGIAIVVVLMMRFCFGMATLVILLLYQHYFTVGVGPLLPGVTGLAEVLAAISLGLLAGAVTTPLLVDWFGRTPTMVTLMFVAAAAILVCGPQFSLPATMIAAVVLAFTYQAVKVCVDAIVQADSDDSYVGRVFAVYDTANNVAYVGAFVVGAVLVPADGRSVALIVVMGVVYVIGGAGYSALMRVLGRPTVHAH